MIPVGSKTNKSGSWNPSSIIEDTKGIKLSKSNEISPGSNEPIEATKSITSNAISYPSHATAPYLLKV